MSSKTPLIICVTGAAGQIAYSFLGMLGNGQVFGHDQPLILHLLDIPQMEGVIKGVKMELEDCAYPLLKEIKTGTDCNEMFKDIDVGVFIGGFPRKQGMERKDLIGINVKIFKEQGAALDKFAKKTVKCLVVANPANTNCLTLSKYAPSIPKENFSCMTRLDHNRMMSQLSIKSNVGIKDVKIIIKDTRNKFSITMMTSRKCQLLFNKIKDFNMCLKGNCSELLRRWSLPRT